MERAEDSPLHHTQAGRFAVPLSLMRGTQRVEDLALILTADQMEALYEEIGTILHLRGPAGLPPTAEAVS
ncbi:MULTISPECIES: hypothetical protein [unclassified Streptomyces]|uniref:hypothetical protein n=1 Tax=unclassified Streptomyces TaxID=2593676 RepID=UPI0022381484|nr:hypothetical protein [Streptomyces sp. SHP 1-2]MCW5249571.1 hypothetical protein [Streptomyces sp. SHP 1-2]